MSQCCLFCCIAIKWQQQFGKRWSGRSVATSCIASQFTTTASTAPFFCTARWTWNRESWVIMSLPGQQQTDTSSCPIWVRASPIQPHWLCPTHWCCLPNFIFRGQHFGPGNRLQATGILCNWGREMIGFKQERLVVSICYQITTTPTISSSFFTAQWINHMDSHGVAKLKACYNAVDCC